MSDETELERRAADVARKIAVLELPGMESIEQ
jgi:hypothetical protein